jgi:alcohol dehydrogenase
MPKVKSCVKAGPGQVELTERTIPDPGPGQALIRTTLTTVCGSDLHMVDDFPIAPAGQPQGHEAVGVIEAVGLGVERLKKGDKVITSCLICCGHCHVCLAGDTSMCRTYKAPLNVLFGCQSEAFIVNSADLNMTQLPDGMTDKQALFTGDIMSTGFAAIERGRLKPGQSVAVFAQGPVGLCATAGAKYYGAGHIIAVESVPERVAMAKKLGAHDVVSPENAVEKIKELTQGKGVDLAVEALGREATLAACHSVIRHGGTISSVGVYVGTREFKFPLGAISSQFTFVTSMCPGGPERLTYLMGLIQSGKVDLSPLWTHDKKLDEIGPIYDLFRNRRDGVLKVAITP